MPAGTGQSEPDVTQIRELEERLDNFRIQVADDLTIRGSAWQGYALNVPICGGPPSGVIACCFEDGSCQLLSPEQCVSSGGTITGGSCDPNPCAGGATGACCIDGVCSILSETDCIDGGGTYQGDDTTCDPSLCCTFCGAYPPPCVDESDLCNTRQACNIDPTFCIGDTVPCDSFYRTLKLYCSDTCELCEIDHLNPLTCEITIECITEGCCSECDGGTSNETIDQVFPCPEMGAFEDPFFQNN